MSHEESISLEETNKIRIKLGLKPLTDDKGPATGKDAEAEENYKKQREQEAKEKEKKALQERIAKVKNRQELNAKLKGKTLGDDDPDVEDTRKWIKRSKKKEKELAKKLQEELALDREQPQEDYTEKDLEGLKVSHDFEAMEEGEERILTLKDSRILENEEDELMNVELAEHEKTKKNQENKIKRRDYTGYDDDEFTPGNAGMKRSLLSKYDEFLEGPQETGFRLGSSVSTSQSKRQEKEQAAASVNKTLLSIDYEKNIEMTDYLKEGDVGFKKPKTKKKRSTRKMAEVSEVTENDDMQVDEKPIVPRQRNLDANFVDDDELQAALARSRRAKTKKPKKLSPEELARQIAEERERSAAANDNVIKIEDDEEEGGLVFDDTSEFVRAITYDPAVKQEPKAEPSLSRAQSRQPSVPAQAAVKSDAKKEDEDVAMAEIEAGEVTIKEEEDDDAEMLDAIAEALHEQERVEKAEAAGDIPVGTASEQTFSSGMAATLNILRTQGILAKPDATQAERERVQLQRDLWLADYRRMQAQRELERAKMRGGNKDQAQREYENRLREQQEARQTLEAYKHYKPDVNIVYHDEFGRELTPKEAWKALSHKFHGKGSGKMKTEKRLKKIAEERKKEAMASGDTPLSMNQAFQARQEKTGQAHFVLSVGNRGAVPQASEFLDPQPLSKGKTEKKNKKKGGQKDAVPQLDSGGFIMLNATQSYNDSPGPVSGAATTNNGSPAPRPGFSRISSSMVEVDSPAGTPGPVSSGTKFVLGLNKRKAGEEPSGTPPPKRR